MVLIADDQGCGGAEPVGYPARQRLSVQMPRQTEVEEAAAPSKPDSGARIDNAFVVGSRSPAPTDTEQM